MNTAAKPERTLRKGGRNPCAVTKLNLSNGSYQICGEAGARSLLAAKSVWLSLQNAISIGAKREGSFCAKFFTIVRRRIRSRSARLLFRRESSFRRRVQVCQAKKRKWP